MKYETPKACVKKTILIVEGHPIVRERLAAVINATPDLAVCGETENAIQAVEAVSALKPDAAIVNFSIDGSVGLKSIEVLKSNHPDLPVIASVLHDEEALVEKAIEVGAEGYITGSIGAEGLSTDKDVIDSVRRTLAAS
ncbi:MAG: response regulator transcription factor [Verrucomicrobiia bacterium]